MKPIYLFLLAIFYCLSAAALPPVKVVLERDPSFARVLNPLPWILTVNHKNADLNAGQTVSTPVDWTLSQTGKNKYYANATAFLFYIDKYGTQSRLGMYHMALTVNTDDSGNITSAKFTAPCSVNPYTPANFSSLSCVGSYSSSQNKITLSISAQ